MKKSKKKARKTSAEAKPAVQTNVNPPAEKYNSFWEEKQLVDYESEEPTRFSPVEEDIYSGEDDYPAHGDWPEANIPITVDFPPIRRRVQTWRGGKARKMFSRRGKQPQDEQEYRRWQPPTRG